MVARARRLPGGVAVSRFTLLSGKESEVHGSRNPRVQYRCSFCGKSQEQIHRLIAGPGGVYICNECIDLCDDIIHEESGQMGTPPPPTREEQLRSKVLSTVHNLRMRVTERDYDAAVSEASTLQDSLRDLQGLGTQ